MDSFDSGQCRPARGSPCACDRPAPVVPGLDGPLQDQDLLREHPVPLLLQEEVLRVLQEDLVLSQLEVGAAKYLLTDLGRGSPAVHLSVKKKRRQNESQSTETGMRFTHKIISRVAVL